jgi:transposase-like protein
MTGERQVPFFCPYCGEESLRPSGPEAGEWECAACARGFQLKFAGVLRPGSPGSGGAAGPPTPTRP